MQADCKISGMFERMLERKAAEARRVFTRSNFSNTLVAYLRVHLQELRKSLSPIFYDSSFVRAARDRVNYEDVERVEHHETHATVRIRVN